MTTRLKIAPTSLRSQRHDYDNATGVELILNSMERTNSRRRKAEVADIDASRDDATTSAQYVSSRTPEEDLKTPGPKSSWHLRTARYLLVVLMFGLLAVVLSDRIKNYPSSFGPFSTGVLRPEPESKDGFTNIGIRLNPADHVHRPSTTLRFDWRITKGFRSPDGVRKEVYLINGQFPGEPIEARSGDRVIVNVTNLLRDEGSPFIGTV